jgi:hypothetical protein
MSPSDDRDLASAFEELSAPPSTANYATRTPVAGIRASSATRWPQVVAAALAVVVAVGAAGTFLALRSARQGGSPAGSAGTPPARSGAAMAFDSTSGVTVMFGGITGSGQPLADTWTWDGSRWRSAAQGPGSLTASRLVDDPADGGVLLIGMPSPPGGTVSTGCAGGGTAVPGSTGSAPGSSGVSSQPRPPVGPVPTDGVPAPGSTILALPASLCPVPAPVAQPTLQTWVFNGSGWHHAAPGTEAATPPPGADLAFDPTSRQVVAVSPPGITCGPPRETPVRSGAPIVCPAAGSDGSSVSIAPAPCGVVTGCVSLNAFSSWTWSGGSWRKAPADTSVQPSGTTLLFDDPATQHAVLMTQSGIGSGGIAYPQLVCSSTLPQSCPPPVPMVTTWIWSGSGWVRISRVSAAQQGPDLGGAAVATVGGHVVVLTTAGDTWTFAAGQWTQGSPSRHPQARTGAAVAEGPNGSVVLFGGADSSGFFVGSSANSLGSDTWIWSGGTWRQLGGTAPVPPPQPSACSGSTGTTVIPPCVQVLPAPAPSTSPTGCSPSAGCIQVSQPPAIAPAATPTPSP